MTHECVVGGRTMENVPCNDLSFVSCGMETVSFQENGIDKYHTRRFCSKNIGKVKGLKIALN